ncbi:MAG: excinuclease ABC subunit UvrC [Desulfovibrio sp.]|nr:excinuclease ABC subunit UvrC [Desulfovibrio sp.]
MQKPDAATIPLAPGVYLYKDSRGHVIYVGKARVLRRRVLSYFRTEGLPIKTLIMIKRARRLDWLTTTTEKEALLLEANLIKKYRPRYNIILRDDKQYVLFRCNTKHAFPRLEIVRRVRKDGARYFGPFTSTLSARETWKLINRAFALRRCTDRGMKNRTRPCLYHHIGQCPAPCAGLVTSEIYQESIRRVCDLLQGRARHLLTLLRKEMAYASESLVFEKAAVLRDQIAAVAQTLERQAAVLPGGGDMDAVGVHTAEHGLALGIVFVRGGAMTDGRTFFWPDLTLGDARELVWSFVNQYYAEVIPPGRVLLPWSHTLSDGKTSVEETWPLETLEQVLCERRSGRVRIATPHSAHDRQLVELANASAREEARRRQSTPRAEALTDCVGRALLLPEPPRRIECVDVSHTGGRQARVGVVVFEDGRPTPSDYRIYSMPDSVDDCNTLHAWVARRLESGPPWADLLLVDGGKGQLSAVGRALREAGRQGLFALAAITKARDEHGQADRRAGNVGDRIFVPGRANPLPLREGSEALLFLQNVRDTAHRFAISRHRRARRKATVASDLMRLPGIGPATARLLWDRFGGVESMCVATREDLLALPGIGRNRASGLLAKLAALRT